MNSGGGGASSASPSSEVASQQPTTGNGTKRKADGSQVGTRSKRNRYISIACNECKRRKIKCNGETPCQRCGNLGLECLYAPNCCNSFRDTDDFKHLNEQITTLQQQVDNLFSNLSSLQSNVEIIGAQVYNPSASAQGAPFDPSSSIPQTPASNGARRPSSAKHPRFQGPTSSAFNIGVAKSSLKTMGIAGPEIEAGDEGMATTDGTPLGSPRIGAERWSVPGTYQKPDNAHADKDPIWMLTKEETLRLVRVYQDEMGLMYPMLDAGKLLRHASMLFSFVEAANRAGLMQITAHGSDAINDDMTNILKLVLACALVLEASGKSPLGKRMFEFVKPVVDAQLLGPPDCKGVQMLILTAMYYFHKDEEQIAWRTVGLACRMCMEIGLHRRDTYALLFKTDEERGAAIRLFWSLYVLDRRWSLGTGMPFAMHEADIDPNLPRPDDSTPYLNTMIAYSSIGSKVWRSVASADGSANTPKISDEEIGYLDYQVLQWMQSIPPSLSYNGIPSADEIDATSRSHHRLRILLYLRGQQMRILIYRPVMHTASAIMENLSYAHTVIDVAKESIKVLHSLNQRTDLYRTQQVMFNYFLISALAVLFLGVAHAPAHFAERCRDEFYMALDLVRGLSADSYVSKRLWRTIRSLKELGPKLGLSVRPQAASQKQDGMQQDAHSSAAVAMAGLAGHQVDENAIFTNGYVRGVGDGLNDSPNGMANDLTSLFEAAGGNALLNGGAFGIGPGIPLASGATAEEGIPNIFGSEDELSRILKDLF